LDEIEAQFADAKKRLDAFVANAEKEIQESCSDVIVKFNKTAEDYRGAFDSPTNPHGVVISQEGAAANRLAQLERKYYTLDKLTANLESRVSAREQTISPERIHDAVADIRMLKDNSTKLSEDFLHHCSDNLKRFETLADRIDEQQLKNQSYYAVISPEKIQEAVADLQQCRHDIREMRKRYDEFIADRVSRLETTNKQIDMVREMARDVENKVMEKIDKNQIRTQQYVIGIVVGLIVTVMTSMILTYMHV
jgi:hypothetical protein